ncbi:hypothetical protein [Neisseria sp. HMSC064E01]|jgi:hypothetical protein|uniref:hypothetical protein n=1 Tax=Neisseria sp. HMSC064E01 TaxID=1715052 RepID=UPI0008A1B63B|nr:hypothetical protein [Neisseria sp. HMSC064E01]OFN85127.1 hypothetical protein HMPREF2572_01510 [Neisseria sp. HMSC064E01]
MNNTLNAKLSKLIYALASDDPNYLAKAGVFDRLLLLIRELYQMLDDSEGLNRLSLRLRYGKRYGMIALDAAAPGEDAGALRLKRWMVYSRIAERIVGCGNDLSVALDDMVVENEEAKQRYTDAANEIIKRFGLAGYVPEPPKSMATAQNEPAPKSEPKSIITRRGSSLSMLNAKGRVESYPVAQTTASMKVSRLRFIVPRSK